MSKHITIGMDLGDRSHVVAVLDQEGTELECRKVTNTKVALKRFFQSYAGARIAIEAGTHSPWISRLLEALGLKVYVGNPRKLRLIWDSCDKSDKQDARILAMVCRVEPKLLWPIFHRGAKFHDDLEVIKARNMLVESRTKLINHVRCVVKARGDRLPRCSAASFAHRATQQLPGALVGALNPITEMIAELTAKIKQIDYRLRDLAREDYPEVECLQQVPGVGPLTALTYVLTLESPDRFSKSRQVGAFLGLTPRRDQSGAVDKQLRISKAGNRYLRKLLVGCGQYILGPFGPDSHLRRKGMAIASRGGRNAKKRAVVAVARKLSVLLHRLWLSSEPYEPFYDSALRAKAA